MAYQGTQTYMWIAKYAYIMSQSATDTESIEPKTETEEPELEEDLFEEELRIDGICGVY